jgi:hypothetical protein
MKTKGTAWIGGIPTNPKSQHWHWSEHRKWAASWREMTAYICRGMVESAPEIPKRITLTAHVRRLFDQSNLSVVMSPVLDGLQVPRPASVTMRKGKQRVSCGWPGAGVIDSDGNTQHEIIFQQVVDKERQGVEVLVEVLNPVDSPAGAE